MTLSKDSTLLKQVDHKPLKLNNDVKSIYTFSFDGTDNLITFEFAVVFTDDPSYPYNWIVISLEYDSKDGSVQPLLETELESNFLYTALAEHVRLLYENYKIDARWVLSEKVYEEVIFDIVDTDIPPYVQEYAQTEERYQDYAEDYLEYRYSYQPDESTESEDLHALVTYLNDMEWT